MKTLEQHHKVQLEAEILKMIIANSRFMMNITINENDFSNAVHKKVFLRMSELFLRNEELSLVNIAETINGSEVAYLYGQTDYFTMSKNDFKAACFELREDVVRQALNAKTSQSGNSLEFFEWVDAYRKINTVYTIETFAVQFAKYEAEYLDIQKRKNQGKNVGLLTGYRKFNDKVGLSECDFCVIGARTSIGKTTFALNLAIEAAAHGETVLFISLEMPRKQIFDKICARLMKRPVSEFKYGRVSLESCKNELKVISDNFFFVFAPECKSSDVQSLAALVPDVKLIVVDYLQLMKDVSLKGENENNRLGRISGKLKMIAGQRNCIVIAPAQLNRGSEKEEREPRLSDIRDSGCIEQDADQVLLLHRENRESIHAKLIIAKNRHGSLDTIHYNFNPAWGWFEEDGDCI